MRIYLVTDDESMSFVDNRGCLEFKVATTAFQLSGAESRWYMLGSRYGVLGIQLSAAT